jgi:hypothetical protein
MLRQLKAELMLDSINPARVVVVVVPSSVAPGGRLSQIVRHEMPINAQREDGSRVD